MLGKWLGMSVFFSICSGRTAVHWAAMLNNIEGLKLLVSQGPDNVIDASNSKVKKNWDT